MTDVPASPDELTLPRVRPFRALKLTLLLLAALGIAFTALWRAWDRRTARLIETRVADYRQRHEPTRLADFLRPTPLPDDRDALFHLRRAAAALPNPMPSDFVNWELNASLTIDAPMQRRGRAFAAATAPALALLPPALACTDANWRSPAEIGYTRPGDTLDEDDPFDSWIRALVTASTVAHLDHDDQTALRHTLDAIRLNRISAGSPSWRAQLVRTQRDFNNWAQIEALLPKLQIEGDDTGTTYTIPFPPPPNPHIPAPRALVDQLLAALLDEAPTADANKRALYAARCELIELPTASAATRRPLRFLNDQPRPPAWRTPFYRLANPYLRRVTADEMDYVTAVIRAAEQPDLRAAAPFFPRPFKLPTGTGIYPADQIQHDLRNYPLDALGRSDFPNLRHRRALAVLLAARLYTLDHEGRHPTTAAKLVPDYLPRVPLDPVTGAPSPWSLPPTPATTAPSPPAPR